MGEAHSKHAAYRLPVRHCLQRDLLRSGLHDGLDHLLLPAPRLHDRALPGGPVLHWPGDLHRILPLLPDLQLLRRRLHPVRGCRWRCQRRQVRPGDLRLLAHRPLLQRCLPLHGLAPDRGPSAASCTPSSSASRSRRMPSPSASVIRSSGLAGPPSSRGAPTRSCTSCRCFPAPPPARLVCPPPPWSPSRSATPSLT